MTRAGAEGVLGPDTVDPVDPVAAVASDLGDGEIVILSIRPHPLYIVLGSLGTLGAVGAALVAALYAQQRALLPVSEGRIWFVAFAVVALRLGWQTLDWLARSYILTNRRVMRYKGVLNRYKFESSLRRVQHISLQKPLLERVFGLGSLGFATAGTGGIEAVWITIGEPEKVREIVRDAIDRAGGGGVSEE